MSKKEIKENDNPGKVEVPTEPVIDAVTEPDPPFVGRDAISAMVDGDMNKFTNMINDTLKQRATVAVDKMEFEVRNRTFNNAQPETEDEEAPEVETAEEESEEETNA